MKMNQLWKKVIAIILVLFLILMEAQMDNMIVYAAQTVSSGVDIKVGDAFLNLLIQDGEGNTIIDLKNASAYTNWKLSPDVTYYLKARVNRPQNKNFVSICVGSKNESGALTYNGLKIVSPPGGVTTVGNIKHDAFDRLECYTDIAEATYGSGKTKYPISDGELIYHIKDTVKTNTYFDFELAFAIDGVVYNNIATLKEALSVSLLGTPSETEKVQRVMLDIPVNKKNTLTTAFNTGNVSTTLGSGFTNWIKIDGNQVALLYDRVEFDVEYPEGAVLEGIGFSSAFSKSSTTLGTMTVGKETASDTAKMRKVHITIKNGYKAYAANLPTYYRLSFPQENFSVNQKVYSNIKNLKAYLKGNDVPISSTSTSASYTLTDPMADATSMTPLNRVVYNQTADIDTDYMVQMGNAYIQNKSGEITPSEKILEVEYNKTNTAAEILAITIPKGDNDNPSFEVTGVTESGETKTVTIMGKNLNTKQVTASSGIASKYYIILAKKYGLRSITHLKADIGCLTPNFTSTNWTSGWGVSYNLAGAFGRFTTDESGIVVTNSYHLYNKNPEKRGVPNGDLSINTIATSTLEHITSMDSLSFSMYNQANQNINNSPYIAAGNSVRITGRLNPYVVAGAVYTPIPESDNGKGVMLPDTTKKQIATSTVMANPILYMFVPKGMNYNNLEFTLTKNQSFEGIVKSESNIKLDYKIESLSYLNNNKDGTAIYKITFPKDTLLGHYDGDGREISLGYNCTFSTKESMATNAYAFNDIFQFTTEKGLRGAVYATTVGQIINTKVDTYGLNKGNELLGITKGVTEHAINLQEIAEIQVENAISVTKTDGKETRSNLWLTYATLGSNNEADPNTIALLGKNSEGQVRVEIMNRGSEDSGEVKIVMPIPQQGVDMGDVFMLEAPGYSMNMTWKEANIPNGFSAKYVMLTAQDKQGAFSYRELEADEKGNAILLQASGMKGKSTLYAYFDYVVESGKSEQLSVFRTAHSYRTASGVFNKVGSYVAASVATGKISGIVFYDVNRNGIQDQGEKGLAGIKAVVTDSKGNVQSKVTDDNGYYEFIAIREEDITLKFEVDASQRENNAYRFNVPSKRLTNAEDGLSTYAKFANVDSQGTMSVPMSNYFSVIYNANGGSGNVPKVEECPENTALTISKNPDNLVSTGYIFKEWNTKADGTGKGYAPGSSIMVTAEACGYDNAGVCDRKLDLYAIWTLGTYNINFNYVGGTPTVPCTSMVIQKGERYSTVYKKTTGKEFPYYNQKLYNAENTPTKNGYEFIGWTDSKTSTKTNITLSSTFNKGEDTTLYALWQPKKGFTVTYNTGKAATPISNKTNISWMDNVLPGNTVAPVLAGYVFEGWMYEGKMVTSEQTYGELAKVERVTSIELTAKWREKTGYTIKYAPGEGVTAISDKSVSWTTSDLFPSLNPKKEGYAFLGWARSQQDANASILIEATSYAELVQYDETKNSVTLYGVWQRLGTDIVVVSYDTAGGSMLPDYITQRDQSGLLPSTNPSKPGYTFIGWKYNNMTVTEKMVYSDIAGEKEAITLTAVWQGKSYTVTYDSNGSNMRYPETIVNWNQEGLLPTMEPTRKGYTFEGWYYNSILVPNTDSLASLSVKDAISNEKVVLIAKWASLTYTVEYNVAGGSYVKPSTGLLYDSNKLLPDENPSKVGYTFDEWTYTKENNGVVPINNKTILSELEPSKTNIVLDANYLMKSGFSVKYDTTGGTSIKAKENVSWMDTSLLPESPTRTGYEFVGWVCGRTPVNETTSYASIATTDKSDTSVTLVAQWKQKKYNIVYMEGNNLFDWAGTVHPEDYTFGMPQALVIPTHETKTFSGWYRSSAFTGSAITTLNEAEVGDKDGNITLYAKWDILPYTTRGTGADIRYITSHNNNSGLKYVRYMYSGDAPLSKYVWKDYVAKGKEYSSVNGTSGYKSHTGTVRITADNQKTSTLDKLSVELTEVGWYNFLLLTDDGKYTYTSYEVAEAEVKIGLPTAEQEGKIVTVMNNGSGLSYIRYMYSGETPLEKYSWSEYCKVGKIYPEVNSTAGYRSFKGIVQDDLSSSIDGQKVTLEKEGWYNFLLTTSSGKNVYVCFEVTKEQILVGTPSTTRDENIITVNNNSSGLLYIRYMYSGSEPLEKYTWSKFCSIGKEYALVNGSTGYKSFKGTVEEDLSSSLDGKQIPLEKKGWYNFLLTTEDGKNVYISYELIEEPVIEGMPNTTRNDNTITIHNNNSGLQYVRYMYSGDVPLEKYSWSQFCNIGKQNTSLNSSKGYLSLTGDVGEDASSSLDGAKIQLIKKGWYNILLTTQSGKNIYVNYRVTEIEGGKIASDGFNIIYSDALTSGKILGYAYKYMGSEEPSELENASYDVTKDLVVQRNETIQGKMEFAVPKIGWYIVEVRDEIIGTQIFKVEVFDHLNEDIRDNPILSIKGLTIQGLPVKEKTQIAFIGLKEGLLVEGDTFVVNQYGVYEMELIDNAGNRYILVANVNNNELNQNMDISKLEASIQTATRLYDSDYTVVEDIESQIEPGHYVTEKEKQMLMDAINEATEVCHNPQGQSQINSAVSKLNSAISLYRAAIKEVIARLVTVEGNKIIVMPEKETYTLQQVYYNADNKKVLVPNVWSDWAGLSNDKEYPYVKVTKFNEEGKLIFDNKENGIYTILVNQMREGTVKGTYQYAIVAVNEDETDEVVITEGTVAKDTLTFYAETAQNKLDGWVKQSEAEPGQYYITDDHYKKISDCLKEAEEMTSTNDPHHEIIPLIIKLRNYMRLAGGGTLMPEEVIAIEEAQLEVEDITVTVTGADVKQVYFSYGNHTNWNSVKDAGYTRITAEEAGGSKKAIYKAIYNGTYTAVINYIDGKSIYHNFEIKSEQAITISHQEGDIVIALGKDMNVLDTVQEVYYGYGTSYTNISDTGLIKYAGQDSRYTLPALGNGMHTILIKMGSGQTHRFNINVDSCKEPKILTYDGHIGIFTNGFDVKSASYAGGVYDNWDEMYETAYYVGTNIWLPMSEFNQGNIYTFYFRMLDNTEYFKTIVVGESMDETVKATQIIEEN